MKTILVIDGADNCAYDCFLASDDLFRRIYPGDGQDIEFIEDLLERSPDGDLDQEFEAMWRRRITKKDVRGIDGILFYELLHKKKFYPNKRDSDLDGVGRASLA